MRRGDDRRRVLVTGAHGFVGARLVAALRSRHPAWEIDAPPAEPGGGTPGLCLDITHADAVCAHIRETRPEIVVHLAAVAAVTAAVQSPRLAWSINLGGTLNLVLALQAHARDAHLLYISSAEVYGASFLTASPANEETLLQPVNPYAASKAAADLLVRQAAADGLSATVMRPFNHIGPGQSEAFVVPSFAAQVARIEAGLQAPEISVGALDDARDFLDVDDVVRAYVMALEQREAVRSAVFNVASGHAVAIREILDRLRAHAKVAIAVKVDPSRLRKTSIRSVVGDASRLRAKLGWEPRTSLDETLLAVLNEKRAMLSGARRIADAPPQADAGAPSAPR